MFYRGLILIAVIHPGVIDVDVGGVVAVQHLADHIVVIVDLGVLQFDIWIILMETLELGFQRLEVVVTADNGDHAFIRAVKSRLEALLRLWCFLLLCAARSKAHDHQSG